MSQGKHRNRIGSLIAEGVVVVASILVAFALDAWWDNRQENEAFLDELASVVSEVEANLASLDLQTRLHQDAIASIDELITGIDDASSETISVPDSLLNRAISFAPSYDPSSGALDAFVSGGWLSRIHDPELRGRISALPSRFQDLQEEEEQARAIAHESLLESLWNQESLRSALYSGGIYYQPPNSRPALPTSSSNIRIPPGMSNRLLFRRAWLSSALGEIEGLRRDLEAVRELSGAYLR